MFFSISKGVFLSILIRVYNNIAIIKEIESIKSTYLKQKKISVSSPVGKGLLGKKVGEIAVIETPRGDMKFEVLDIFL